MQCGLSQTDSLDPARTQAQRPSKVTFRTDKMSRFVAVNQKFVSYIRIYIDRGLQRWHCADRTNGSHFQTEKKQIQRRLQRSPGAAQRQVGFTIRTLGGWFSHCELISERTYA